MTPKTSPFDLPPRLAAKADPALIDADERHFALIQDSLEQTVADLSDGSTPSAGCAPNPAARLMERDMEIRRLETRLRTLERYGLDLCLGRMVGTDGSEPVYVGRLGLNGRDGERLLIDWRSPAAEPFFAATHANRGPGESPTVPVDRGRITDYWDEVFTAEGLRSNAALDDQSAFIASLGTSRSAHDA